MIKDTMLEYLQKQFFVNGFEYDGEGISVKQLNDELIMQELIVRRTAEFGGTDIEAGGAHLMRWFGCLFTAHIYLYSMNDQWLRYDDFSFLEKGKKGEIQLLSPVIINALELNREEHFIEELRNQVLVFRPIVECITKITKLPIQQVWGLLSNPFYKAYGEWTKGADTQLQKRLENDLQVIKGLDPGLFGLKRNPFHVSLKHVENWKKTGEPIQVKVACCMSYLKASGNNCYSCPKMSKVQRVERGNQLLLAQNKQPEKTK